MADGINRKGLQKKTPKAKAQNREPYKVGGRIVVDWHGKKITGIINKIKDNVVHWTE